MNELTSPDVFLYFSHGRPIKYKWIRNETDVIMSWYDGTQAAIFVKTFSKRLQISFKRLQN